MPVGCPVIAEPGTRVLRPAGLSSAERILDSLCVWELHGLDATTPVATRTSHSWEQIICFESALLLVHCASPSCAPIQSATEAWSGRLAAPRPNA